MKEYISIAEYAKRAGISPQAAYKRIVKPEFKEFIKVDNRKKYVDTAIFAEGIQPSDKPNSTELNQPLNQSLNQVDNATNKLIAALEAQIKEKDEQINRLLDQLTTQQELLKNEQIKQYQKQLETANRGFFKRLFSRRNSETDT